MSKPDFDLCVIGGGINGTGVARDAAGRGLSVLLIEKDDLASATSSASTKLIHGGLRYLEYYEFRLVHKALKEREVLLNLAPHIISPLDFILPHEPHLRPAWMIRIGLFLYDRIGGNRNKLPSSKGLDLSAHPYGKPLQEQYIKGFSYADCRVDDARLVVLNAIDAKKRGATILTRTACTKLVAKNGNWTVTLRDMNSKKRRNITAAKVVNAAGPWVRNVVDGSALSGKKTPDVRLVKGSHIIVPKLFEGEQAYILQQPDQRIIFAIPYEGEFTLIGTTDVDYKGNPAKATITKAETTYLCEAINRSFKTQIGPDRIIWSYSGVRPLLDGGDEKAAATTRDYKLDLDKRHGPELLSIFGGKITTYRELSEHAVDMLFDGKHWTNTAPLPGGKIPEGDFDKFLKRLQRHYKWIPPEMLQRYARLYGARINHILKGSKSLKELGEHFGDNVYEAEIRYLIDNEWAQTMEDILLRRTKLGLHIGEKTVDKLEKFLEKANGTN